LKLYHERNFVGAQQLTAHYKFKILAASWAILSENLVVLGYWVPVKLYPSVAGLRQSFFRGIISILRLFIFLYLKDKIVHYSVKFNEILTDIP
jgi:hypothetical protein